MTPELVRLLCRREKFVASAWNFVLVQSIAKAVYEVGLSSTSEICQKGLLWNN